MEWIRDHYEELLNDPGGGPTAMPYPVFGEPLSTDEDMPGLVAPPADGYSSVSEAPTNNTLGPGWTSMMSGAETLMMDMENGEVPGATQEFLYAEGRPYYQVPQRDLIWLDTPQRRFVQDVTSLHEPPICVLVDGSSDHEF